MQSAAETESDKDTAKVVLVAGLFVQIVVFGVFIIVTALFHRRVTIRPTPQSERINAPWATYIFVLYVVSALIMIRSIFRVIEYIGGREGELQSKEIYFYLLDTLLMFFVSIVFNWYHPSTIIAPASNKGAIPLAESVSDRSMENV